MDLNLLKLLPVLADEKSVTKAADRLFILAETFDVYVRDHPAVVADLRLDASAADAAGALHRLLEQITAALPNSQETGS